MSKPLKKPVRSVKGKQYGYFSKAKTSKINLPKTAQNRKADKLIPGWIDNIK